MKNGFKRKKVFQLRKMSQFQTMNSVFVFTLFAVCTSLSTRSCKPQVHLMKCDAAIQKFPEDSTVFHDVTVVDLGTNCNATIEWHLIKKSFPALQLVKLDQTCPRYCSRFHGSFKCKWQDMI